MIARFSGGGGTTISGTVPSGGAGDASPDRSAPEDDEDFTVSRRSRRTRSSSRTTTPTRGGGSSGTRGGSEKEDEDDEGSASSNRSSAEENFERLTGRSSGTVTPTRGGGSSGSSGDDVSDDTMRDHGINPNAGGSSSGPVLDPSQTGDDPQGSRDAPPENKGGSGPLDTIADAVTGTDDRVLPGGDGDNDFTSSGGPVDWIEDRVDNAGDTVDRVVDRAGDTADDVVDSGQDFVRDEYVRPTRGIIDQAAEGVSQSDLGQAAQTSANELTPHVGMSAGGNKEALQTRAEKEERMAELAESGWEDITSGRAPSGEEISGLIFQTGETAERYLGEKGRDIEEGSPTHNPAEGEQFGDVPGNIASGLIGGVGMGLGAVTQLAPSAAYDIDQRLAGEETASEQVGNAGILRNTAQSQVEMFKERPYSSGALVAAPIVGPAAKAGAKGYTAGGGTLTYPAAGRFSAGGSKGVTVGLKTSSGKVDTVRPGVTIATKTEGKTPIETGTPRLSPEAVPEGGFGTKLSGTETKAVSRLLDDPAATRIESFRNTQAETQYSNLKPGELKKTFEDVAEAQGVDPRVADAIVDTIKQEGGEVYGSTVQRNAAGRVGEPGVARTPRDIDVSGVSSKAEFAKRITERVNEAAGEEVVVLEGGTPVSKKTGGKLFDIHEAEGSSPYTLLGGQREATFGVRAEGRSSAPKSSEGIKTTTLSEQTRRKGAGAMEVVDPAGRTVGDLSGQTTPAHAGRIKDIGDFYMGERANIAALEARGMSGRAARATESLESWLDTYGPELAGDVRGSYSDAGGVTKIADFGETTAPGGKGPGVASPGGPRTPDAGSAPSSPSPSGGKGSGPDATSPAPRDSPDPGFDTPATELLEPSSPGSKGPSSSSPPPAYPGAGLGGGPSSPDPPADHGGGPSWPQAPLGPVPGSSAPGDRESEPPSGPPSSPPSTPPNEPPSTPPGSPPSTPPSSPPSSPGSPGPAPSGSPPPSSPPSLPPIEPPGLSKPFEDDEAKRKKSHGKTKRAEADVENPFAIGYLGETYAGYAGIDVGSAFERTSRQDIESQGAFFGEALPSFTGEQASEFEATVDFLGGGFEEDPFFGEEDGWV